MSKYARSNTHTHERHVLTRAELRGRGFSPEQCRLVQEMQQHGWRGYVSHRGHAILFSPDGTATSGVSTKNTTTAKVRREFRAWLRSQQTTREDDVTMVEDVAPPVPVEEPVDPLACTEPGCAFVAANESLLRAHVAGNHSGEHVCATCGASFATASALGGHGSKHREAGAIVVCSECGDTFTSANGLAGHRKVHTGRSASPQSVRRRDAEAAAWLSMRGDDATTAELAGAIYGVEPDASTKTQRTLALAVLRRLVSSGRALCVVEGGHGVPSRWRSTDLTPAEPVTPAPAPEPVVVGAAVASDVVIDYTTSVPEGADAEALVLAVRRLVAAPLIDEVHALRRENDGLRVALDEANAALAEATREVEDARTKFALTREVWGL